MTRRDWQIILKLHAEINVINELLEGYDEARFLDDERTMRAVCMTLINIGELVKNLSDDAKADHPRIPWRAISGMRDITAHRYQTLKMIDVYATCKKDVPEFDKELNDVLTHTPEGLDT